VALPPGAPQAQNPPPYGAPPPPPPPPPYGNPPQAQWGAPPPAPSRCQLGHDIAPGQNYCPQGHPIALEGVQFAGNAPPPYAQQPGAYGGQGYAAPPYPGGYAQQPPPPAPPQYGGAPYASGPPQQQAYAPQQQPQYAPQQPQPGQPLPGYTPPPAPIPLPQAQAQPPAPDPNLPPGARVLRGFLVSYQTNPQGDFWPLHSGRLTIGRSNSGEALDVPLADATISSKHAAMTVDPGAGPILVEDTGSTNGTFVNDEHLGFNGRRELRDGDRVRFGGYTAIVKVIART
jgi:pSer/pThr/pTyr-binding forkhead associated (FHA) protein